MGEEMINERPARWWSERVNDEDGEIHYEAHGPKESYIRFEGPNAKADCDLFMMAVEEKI